VGSRDQNQQTSKTLSHCYPWREKAQGKKTSSAGFNRKTLGEGLLLTLRSRRKEKDKDQMEGGEDGALWEKKPGLQLNTMNTLKLNRQVDLGSEHTEGNRQSQQQKSK